MYILLSSLTYTHNKESRVGGLVKLSALVAMATPRSMCEKAPPPTPSSIIPQASHKPRLNWGDRHFDINGPTWGIQQKLSSLSSSSSSISTLFFKFNGSNFVDEISGGTEGERMKLNSKRERYTTRWIRNINSNGSIFRENAQAIQIEDTCEYAF